MKSIISLSGGLDSAVLLGWLLDERQAHYRDVMAVTFAYGSKHNSQELNTAALLTRHYSIPHRVIDLDGVVDPFKKSALAEGNPTCLPEGHYAEESMRQTVIPGRNMIFLSILAGIAESVGAQYVFIGTHAGDHFIYPDCRPAFLMSMDHAVRLSSEGKVEIRAPFVDVSKVAIVAEGIRLKTPFNLTWTCYKGHRIACGKCGSCQERLEAFKANNFIDPVTYDSRELISQELMQLCQVGRGDSAHLRFRRRYEYGFKGYG